jgi:RsiW-degrading membrane proteinase PrsW (M82 family)
MNWYYMDGGSKVGPFDDSAAKALILSRTIKPATLVCHDGLERWIVASDSEELKGYFASVPQSSTAQKITSSLVNAGQSHAKTIISDLKRMDWKAELLPIDESNLKSLMGNSVFWFVALLGVVPLLIVTIEGNSAQLTAFALFFAAIWGVIFNRYVIKGSTHWMYLAGAFFFTGLAGMNIYLWLAYNILPSAYMEMPGNDNRFVSLLGFVFQTGVCEELCKLLPCLIYLAWKRRAADPMILVEIGVFSGLGFAAFENVSYGDRSISSSYQLTNRYGAAGLAVGVQGAMITTMLRSLSLVFCHAVWAGTFSYFVAMAASSRKRIGALFVVGLAVSSVLHGVYDWFCCVQTTVAALLAGLSFVLFYGYLSKLRNFIRDINMPTDDTLVAVAAVDATPSEAAAPNTILQCQGCGNPLREGEQFCGKCGVQLS